MTTWDISGIRPKGPRSDPAGILALREGSEHQKPCKIVPVEKEDLFLLLLRRWSCRTSSTLRGTAISSCSCWERRQGKPLSLFPRSRTCSTHCCVTGTSSRRQHAQHVHHHQYNLGAVLTSSLHALRRGIFRLGKQGINPPWY